MSDFLFKDRNGQTPLPEELKKGLKPKHIQNMGFSPPILSPMGMAAFLESSSSIFALITKSKNPLGEGATEICLSFDESSTSQPL